MMHRSAALAMHYNITTHSCALADWLLLNVAHYWLPAVLPRLPGWVKSANWAPFGSRWCPKFGFGALLATVWITHDHWATYKKNKNWATFRQCWVPWLLKIWQPWVLIQWRNEIYDATATYATTSIRVNGNRKNKEQRRHVDKGCREIVLAFSFQTEAFLLMWGAGLISGTIFQR